MLVSLDCPFLIVISLTSFSFDVNVSVFGLSIPDCHISKIFFLCMSMSVSLDCPFLIVLSLTSFSCVCQCQCIDIHKKKTLEIEQSGIRNPETLTLTYTKKKDVRDNLETLILTYTSKRFRDVTIRNGQSRETSLSVSLDCPFLIVLSLMSFSCICQCQCL
jgi:hypothetical protein